MNTTRLNEKFRDAKYAIARRAVSKDTANIFANYAILQTVNPSYYVPDAQERLLSKFSGSRYADAFGESMLLSLQPLMTQIVGEELLPSYSFLRIYSRGSRLGRHRDRPGCEISASMALGLDSKTEWPLWVESNGKSLPINLKPGDMLVYEGMQVPHWREPFEGNTCIQVFFHYVRAAGKYTHCKFDERPSLGPVPKPEPAQKTAA